MASDSAETPPASPDRPALGDFTVQTEAYRRARPTYPSALIGRLAARAGVGPRDPVADLGAGTGISTLLLLGRDLQVTAVEPNARMREEGRRSAPDARWVDGTFESTGLPEASQVWVVAAQSFHWADPQRALPELWRILRPGGRLSVWWNDRDTDASLLLRRTLEAIRTRVPGFDEAYRDRDWGRVLVEGGWFADPVADAEEHRVPMDRERYLDLWRSHNRLSVAAGLDGVRELVDEIAGWWTTDEPVDIPYVCRSWTVERNEAP